MIQNLTRKSVISITLTVTAIAVIGIAARLQSQSSRAILNRTPVPADHQVSYGKDPLQFGELRLPKGAGPHPVAVIVHGGCWLSQFGLSYMSHLSAALTESGIATWSLEFRRIGDNGGGWPGTFQDVAQGTDYLRVLAKTYPLDLNRVVAIGHSAGGHLVLWLGARNRLPKESPLYQADPLPLRGVAAIAAITDLRRTGTACDQAVSELMGGSAKDVGSRYDHASPIELLPLGVKHTLIQGEVDNIVPLAMVRDYADAAKKKKDDVRLLVIEEAGHFEPIDPKSSAWPKVKAEVLALLNGE
jgi:acetyl esterase/lipase